MPAVRQGIVDIISPGVVVDLAVGERMGLVNRVLPDAELEKFVLDYAAMIAGNLLRKMGCEPGGMTKRFKLFVQYRPWCKVTTFR